MTLNDDGSRIIEGSIDFRATSNATAYLSVRSRFAAHWIEDALAEAVSTTGASVHRRRLEIVFAASAAESYLVQWVADLPPDVDHPMLFERLEKYFPRTRFTDVGEEANKALSLLTEASRFSAEGHAKNSQRLIDQAIDHLQRLSDFNFPNLVGSWNKLPRVLAADGFAIKVVPKRKQNRIILKEFQNVIDSRNDIIHARINWPRGLSSNPKDPREPRTSPDTLANVRAGWATSVVLDRILLLHAGTGTDVPAWVTGARTKLSRVTVETPSAE